MRWLLDNHVSPEQYQSLQIDIGTKVDKSSLNFTTLNSLLTEMKEIKNKLQNMKAVYMITNTGTISTEHKQEHILTEINMNRMIISYQFYFQTSNVEQWHDLKTSAIVGVLGYSYLTTKIIGDKKYIIFYTFYTDWQRKQLFSNFYSLNYKLEYVYTEQISV